MKTAKQWCQDAHFSQEEGHACCLAIILAIQADALESAAREVAEWYGAHEELASSLIAKIRALKPKETL